MLQQHRHPGFTAAAMRAFREVEDECHLLETPGGCCQLLGAPQMDRRVAQRLQRSLERFDRARLVKLRLPVVGWISLKVVRQSDSHRRKIIIQRSSLRDISIFAIVNRNVSYAEVVKLANTRVSEARAERLEGSTPSLRIIFRQEHPAP